MDDINYIHHLNKGKILYNSFDIITKLTFTYIYRAFFHISLLTIRLSFQWSQIPFFLSLPFSILVTFVILDFKACFDNNSIQMRAF